MMVVDGPVPLEDVLYQLRKSSRIAPLQILAGDAVLDDLHVRHAQELASRAFAQGRNQADSLPVEFVRYVSGERQIRKALAKVGATDESAQLVLVGFGDKSDDAERHFAHALGLHEAKLPPRDEAWLLAWGISEAMLHATTPERHPDLVLERVAAVELMK